MSQLHLNADEQALLESPPSSHRITLDGHCALAGARDQVVVVDVEAGEVHRVDLADIDPMGWVS